MEEQNELIKKKILAELGYLNYMEKKKIRNDVDQAFVEKELVEIKKRKKYQIVSAVIMAFALICAVMSLVYDSQAIVSTRIMVRIISIFIGLFSLIGILISQLIENQRREIIYRILSFYNKQNQNTV